jgi:hypothetical protein
MTKFKLEKTMVKTATCPLKGVYRVACGTIFRKTGFDMVRIFCSHIDFPVTIDAVHPGDIKTNKSF